MLSRTASAWLVNMAQTTINILCLAMSSVVHLPLGHDREGGLMVLGH